MTNAVNLSKLVAPGKTPVINNSITLSGTDGTTITLPATTGTVPLNNQTAYIGTTAVAINRASANLSLTGISSVALPGATSGTITLQPAAVAGSNTITLPATTGTVALQGDTHYIGTTGVALNRASANLALTGVYETKVVVAASQIDLALGSYFTKTNSGGITWSAPANIPTSGTAASFILELTNGGSTTMTWWSGIKWGSGSVPTFTAAGVDIIGFYTHDGGTTWRANLIAKDSK